MEKVCSLWHQKNNLQNCDWVEIKRRLDGKKDESIGYMENDDEKCSCFLKIMQVTTSIFFARTALDDESKKKKFNIKQAVKWVDMYAHAKKHIKHIFFSWSSCTANINFHAPFDGELKLN